jgi:hypothetical protein
MSSRRSILALVAAAAVALTACSGATASSQPSIALPSVPASISTEGLEGFCQDFASELQADWPNIDSTTAASLSTVMAEWSANPALEPVAADVQTIGTWLASAATAGSVASPPPDVVTAFDNVAAFLASNC